MSRARLSRADGVHRALVEQRERRAAHELRSRARLLLDGYDNSENDPSLVFQGVTFEDAARAALDDPSVAAVLRRVPPDYWTRPR